MEGALSTCSWCPLHDLYVYEEMLFAMMLPLFVAFNRVYVLWPLKPKVSKDMKVLIDLLEELEL